MDNRVNDMATPGCSHWAPLPVAEAQPALPSLQTLSGARNTSLNMHRLPVPLYLTPPPPGYIASEQVVANQLRSLVMSMEKQPSAEALVEMTGVSKSMAQQLLMPSLNPGPLPQSAHTDSRNMQVLNIFLRKTLAKEDGHVAALRTACPRLPHEENSDYAFRLAMKSTDPCAISVLAGVSISTAYKICRIAGAERDGRADSLRQAVTRNDNELSGDYARRLIPFSRDDAAISAASGMELGSVMWIRRELRQVP